MFGKWAGAKVSSFAGRFKSFFGNYWVQRGFRVTRVGVLVFTVYTTGYRAGLTDFAADPEQMKLKMLTGIIRQTGATSLVDDSDPLVERLKGIGHRIVHAAHIYCMEQHDKADEQDIEDKKAWKDKWEEATKRMNGEWEYIMVDSPVPNAFVTDSLPKMIFVHKGLFTEINPTDEELALVLSHEVSHLIHEHMHSRSYVDALLAVAQLLAFVFIDPTGTWYYAFDIGAARLSKYMTASYSRETEVEADITGLQIAARACYETRGAGKIFAKFAAYKGNDGTATSWHDSHPSDASREKYLQEASELHNPETYNPNCHRLEGYLAQFQKAMTRKRPDVLLEKEKGAVEVETKP